MTRPAACFVCALLLFGLSACDQVVTDSPADTGTGNEVTNFVTYDSDVAAKNGKGSATRHENAVKYRDSGKPNGRGSKGNTTLTARAMLDIDEVVLLEVTTGELDSDQTAPGTITRIQVKSLEADGKKKVRWTENYNGLDAGGYAAFTYSDLKHEWPLSVQASVTGIDKGSTVVSVDQKVWMRPNLVMGEIGAPQTAGIGEEFEVSAMVTETNRDLGARTDCVLWIDGQEHSRVNQMWIDAAGLATCLFPDVSIVEPGTHSLKVVADGVRPGDYDSSDNMAEVTVEILGSSKFRWNANARIDIDPFEYYQRSLSRQYWEQKGQRQTFSVSGSTANEQLTFPMDIRLSMDSGSHAWNSEVFDQVSPTVSYSRRGRHHLCFEYWGSSEEGQIRLSVCQRTLRRGRVRNTFSYSRYASDVVYVSSQYGGGYYRADTDTMLPYESTLSFRMSLSGDNGVSSYTTGTVPLIEAWDDVSHEYNGMETYRYTAHYLSGTARGFID